MIAPRTQPLRSRKWKTLIFAGRVHDVGKLFIPDRILNKPGALTEDELAMMKKHPQVGAEVLRAIPEIERVAQAVESHHEAFDGSGYPLRAERREYSALWPHYRCCRRLCEYDERSLFRPFEDRRASAGGTGQAERHAFRWHDRPAVCSPAQNGKSTELWQGKLLTAQSQTLHGSPPLS